MKKFSIILMLFVVATFACRNDPTTITKNIPDPTEIVTTDVGGIVVDENNVPLKNVTVELAGEVITTNELGLFNFTSIQVDKRSTYVKASKNGYFHGSKTFGVEAGGQQYTRITLMEMNAVESVAGSTGGMAAFDGFTVDFPQGSFIDNNGNPYTGSVKVFGRHLDPSADNFADIAPGRLEGIALDGSLSGMVSMGMIVVELESTSGQELQIADGKKATLTMDVPASFASVAPQTIPLWSFDEVDGIWKEEGEAIFQNGQYVGEVSHFSFWNTDYKDPLVEVVFKVVDQNGNPFENVLVSTTYVADGTWGRGYTNSDGHINGLVPSDKVLLAQVYLEYPCLNPILSENIGPLAGGDTICLVVTVPPHQSMTIKGTVLDCNNDPIPNGQVIANGNVTSFAFAFADSDGHFELTIHNTCLNVTDVDLVAYDIVNLLKSDPTTYPFVSGTTDVGDIMACQSIPYIFYFESNGDVIINDNPEAAVVVDSLGTTSYIQISTPLSPFMTLSIDNFTGVGTYLVGTNSGGLDGFYINDKSTNTIYHCDPCSISVDITDFGNEAGGDVVGTYSGTAGSDNGQVPVSGYIRAVRTN